MYATLRSSSPIGQLLFALAALATPLRAATFTVTTTADSGAGSLRQAILDANGSSGADLIDFDIPVGSCSAAGVCEIVLASVLPAVTEAVTIDGTTQPRFGTAPANVCATAAFPSYLRIQLRLTSFTGDDDLLSVTAAPTTVRGLSFGIDSSGFYNAGVYVGTPSGQTWLNCNHFGIDGTGSAGLGLGTGVEISEAGGTALIGTNGDGIGDVAERNVFGNCSYGVNLNLGSNGRISGNYFGVGADGTSSFPDAICILARQSSLGNLFGSDFNGVSDEREANVVANCSVKGFLFNLASNASGNVVAGNWIGVDALGNPATSIIGISLAASSPQVEISRNRIEHATTAGVDVTSASTSASSAGDCIRNNAIGLRYNDAGTLAFSGSFWGDASGPSGNGGGGGTGDSIVLTGGGSVTFSPFLDAEPHACVMPFIFADGFESDGTICAWSAQSGSTDTCAF